MILTATLSVSTAAFAQTVATTDQGTQTGPSIKEALGCKADDTICRPRVANVPQPRMMLRNTHYVAGPIDPTDAFRQCMRKGSKVTMTAEDGDDGFSLNCKVDKKFE